MKKKIKEKDLLRNKLLEKLVFNQKFFVSLEGSKPIKIPYWQSYRLTKKFLYIQKFLPIKFNFPSSIRLYYSIEPDNKAIESLIENLNSLAIIIFFQYNTIFLKPQIQHLDFQKLNLELYSKLNFYKKFGALLKRRLSAIQ